MSFYWSTGKIAEILGLKIAHTSQPVSAITTDSRQVKPGTVFVAIKGDTHDGHQFIEKAFSAGAVAVISEMDVPSNGAELFKVGSTMAAIRKLAHDYRKSFSIPFIAVVGAVGKTTTKELIASLLAGKFKNILKTEGSQNGFLGIPLTLLELKPDTEIAVIEIGIDEIGAMKQHLELVEPTHSILTKIGPEHLHQLKTVEIAAEEELKAFDDAVVRQTPLAINLSDEYVFAWFQKNRSKLALKKHKTYSMLKSLTPEYLGIYDAIRGELTVQTAECNCTFSLPLPGEHHAHNLLAAVTLCRFFDLTPAELKTGLATFKTAFGRTELYTLPSGAQVIGDYYNSNPTSLEASLKLLNEQKGNRQTYAVLGDMLELGDNEERFHREIADVILKEKVKGVLLYGPRMKWLADELKKKNFNEVNHFETHENLLEALKPNLSKNSHLLIKGSRGMKMEKIMQALLPEVRSH